MVTTGDGRDNERKYTASFPNSVLSPTRSCGITLKPYNWIYEYIPNTLFEYDK
jgi:hypothetical protein